MKIPPTRAGRAVMLLLLLSIGFAGCKSAARTANPAALMREANTLLQEGNKTTDQWIKEYGQAFNPQSRAQFPGNRDSLRAHADSITKLLDENTRQWNKAVEKYEEAIPLIKDEKQRRGATLILSALRKSRDFNDAIRSQMQLVSDERIVDAKAFDEKFLELLKPVRQMDGQWQAEFDEGRRLLGM
jgi:hypothetical protein